MKLRASKGLLVLLAGAMGCVTVNSDTPSAVNTKLSTSRKIPSARGQIAVTPTSTSNSVIELSVKHLARPEKIIPRAKSYVVWELLPGSKIPQSLGPLIVDKNFSAHMKTVTPFPNFDLFVTAEAKPNPIEPTGERLLWTTINR
jgi:hypothetical protein